jgi:hypothetical protein
VVDRRENCQTAGVETTRSGLGSFRVKASRRAMSDTPVSSRSEDLHYGRLHLVGERMRPGQRELPPYGLFRFQFSGSTSLFNDPDWRDFNGCGDFAGHELFLGIPTINVKQLFIFIDSAKSTQVNA